ncbi:hypothetical protein PAAG_09057 [Paracoccidioides lutzii Pb01]|uniref:Uncharacterized protein n=1 Tax=Paracoccidioides lutzii (strain ATCC MYA-826 / Pb01) TaxID=502779 RepID=C1HE60_PARBA|nr:hypothetical protein PAAG_09057 [Paracoccidioides lutzii Pb01]EEH40600.1 hypothetical protein PAAG_09057 [Paracoccidioides lutzii Pb01]
MRDQLLHPTPSSHLCPAKKIMAADKQHLSGRQAKPFTPIMSSSFRTPKSPLTPKLAGYAPTCTTHKTVYPESTQHPRHGLSYSETSTPTSSMLSSNVTPRSGQRLSRRDGNPSPAEISPISQHPIYSTLIPDPPTPPPLDLIPKEDRFVAMPRIARAENLVNDTQCLTTKFRHSSSCGSSTGTPMFFHADDTRSSQSTTSLYMRTGSLQKQAGPSTFIYAYGSTSESSHRDGSKTATPWEKTPRLPSLKRPELTVSSRSKQTHIPGIFARDSHALRHHQSPSNSHPTPISTSDVSFGQQSPTTHNQQPLPLDSPRRSSHTKSYSLDASHHVKQHKQEFLSNLSGTPQLGSRSGEHQLLLTTAPQELNPRVVGVHHFPPTDYASLPSAGLHSSMKEDVPRNSNIDKMNELALNARRERKVLDLEISNSSLLAINRALEREMRKQNSELRRYRRLTRSGRLMIPESISTLTENNMSAVGATLDEPNDIYLTNSLNEDLSDPSDNESSLSDNGTPSLNGIVERDEKHLTRDEKRFIIDLTKHKQVLIDSQMMNQSIKRCLGWTESLILEAKRALDYHVHLTDIDIGGRVLFPDEIEGEAEGGRGLLGSTQG